MEPLLVVGAGPTGLAAALFLSKAGLGTLSAKSKR
jgi:phytoene dehydrogenase-like protein